VIWHPLLLAVVSLDLLALLFVLYGAQTYVRVLLRWEPEATDSEQIRLEGAVDAASFATRFGSAFFLGATLLLVVGISLLLPPLISGAMCGTGVLTAMGAAGWRALILRALALVLLWVWRTLDGVDRSCPRPPAVPLVSRWQLLTVPVVALSLLQTVRIIRRLDPNEPVDCCQVVYDTYGSVREATESFGLTDRTWIVLAAAGASTLLVLLSWEIVRSRRAGTMVPESAALNWGLPVGVVLFVPIGTLTLVKVLAAYHYQVLHHHCPWCLFLPEHGAVGYPLFGALLLIVLEGAAFLAAGQLRRTHPSLGAGARSRQYRAAMIQLFALLILVALTAGPAVRWRLAHGVWMH
jgi:hypothetical protein